MAKIHPTKHPLLLCALLMLPLLSSCGIYSHYERPSGVIVPTHYRADGVEQSLSSDSGVSSLASLSWRDVFTDPMLQVLIDSALVRNVDMANALLNIEKAEAGLLSAGLSYAPNLSFAPTTQRSFAEGTGWVGHQQYQLPLAASWEIDLSGRLLNQYRGAQAQKEIATEQAKLARLSLIAGVANTYYTLQMLDQQLAISRGTQELWRENLRVMQLLKDAGNMTQAAVSQSEAQLASITASIAELEDRIRTTENALCLLLREQPHTIQRSGTPMDYSHLELSAGVPAQLLSHRPDVRLAESSLAAAYYGTASARSSFLPSLRINANGSWTNTVGQAIVSPLTFVGNLIGGLTQPILNNGRNVAQLRTARAAQQQAANTYQQTILAASAEVSDALSAISALDDILQARAQQVQALAKAVETTQMMMRLSNASYIEVITAQQQHLAAQLAMVADQTRLTQSVITLYRALGGGETMQAQLPKSRS